MLYSSFVHAFVCLFLPLCLPSVNNSFLYKCLSVFFAPVSLKFSFFVCLVFFFSSLFLCYFSLVTTVYLSFFLSNFLSFSFFTLICQFEFFLFIFSRSLSLPCCLAVVLSSFLFLSFFLYFSSVCTNIPLIQCPFICCSEISEDEREQQISDAESLTEQQKYWASIGWTESDSVPTAIAVGTVGGILLFGTPFILVFLMDLPSLHRDLCRALRTVMGKQRKKAAKPNVQQAP